MQTRLIAIWDRLRSGFWFIPSACVLVALVAGLAIPWLDGRLEGRWAGSQWVQTTGPSARALLTTLAGVLVTVAGVVFSATMVTMSLTTSQYGSRLLRNLMQNNATQLTMGVFLGTGLYCLLVLRTVQTLESSAFVPHVSVGVAVLASLGAAGLLVYFIHHVASAIQAQNVIWSVAGELDTSIDDLYPDPAGEAPAAVAAPPGPDANARTIAATVEGYVQAVDSAGLVEDMGARNMRLHLRVRPGDFVTRGTAIAVVERLGSAPHSKRESIPIERAINTALYVGRYRTPRQDVECAVLELVEVAVRALSPGINDPRTAIACVDRLGASLYRLAGRRLQSPCLVDDAGTLRVVRRTTDFDSVLAAAFQQIRQYGGSSAAVTIRLVEALEVVAPIAMRNGRADAIRREADMLGRSAERNLPEENDVADVTRALERLRSALR